MEQNRQKHQNKNNRTNGIQQTPKQPRRNNQQSTNNNNTKKSTIKKQIKIILTTIILGIVYYAYSYIAMRYLNYNTTESIRFYVFCFFTGAIANVYLMNKREKKDQIKRLLEIGEKTKGQYD